MLEEARHQEDKLEQKSWLALVPKTRAVLSAPFLYTHKYTTGMQKRDPSWSRTVTHRQPPRPSLYLRDKPPGTGFTSDHRALARLLAHAVPPLALSRDDHGAHRTTLW